MNYNSCAEREKRTHSANGSAGLRSAEPNLIAQHYLGALLWLPLKHL